VRKKLSQLITCAGIALGLAAAAGFVALMWPAACGMGETGQQFPFTL